MSELQDTRGKFKRGDPPDGTARVRDTSYRSGRNSLKALGLAGLGGMVLGLLAKRRRCAPQLRGSEDDRFE